MRHYLKLIWKRLPYIALYSVVFYAIFFVGQALFYRYMPASFFLNYYNVTIPNASQHYEHEPVPYTVCRDAKASYPFTGKRLIYKLPNEVARDKGQLIKSYSISSVITPNKCNALSITPKVYDFSAGSYYFRTYVNFEVHGNEKQVYFESPTFSIQKKVLTQDDLIKQIEQNQQEIENLKRQLQGIAPLNSTTVTTTTNHDATPATATNPATPSSSTTTSSNTANPSDAKQPNEPAPAPQPSLLSRLPLIGGLFK